MKEPSPLADRNTRASGKCHPWLFRLCTFGLRA